ncbi:MAG: GvpL/GvpF family gas vesicle protein [Beijerinckiaceae bacterium]
MSAYLYVYAILRAGASVPAAMPAVAAPGGSARLISFGPLSALVSSIEEPEIMTARRHMMAHTKMIEAAMAEQTLLPMRFGVIVDDEAAIARVLEPKQADLLAMLAELDGRIEAGVRASWNEATLYREIVAVRPDLARRADALKQMNPQGAYYDRIDLGRDVDSAMAVKRFEENKALVERLKPFAVRHVQLKESDDMNVMNVALLIERHREAELIAAIEAIDSTESERLRIKVVTPAPVYNFVKLRLEFAAPSDLMKGAA